MKKKLKKQLKRVYVKVNRKQKRYVYNKVPVFTVKEICNTLNIKVPKEYKEIKNAPVHKTYLFDKLENKDQIRSEIKHIFYRRPNYVRQLKSKMKRFKDIYEEQIIVLKGTDAELIQMMVEWLYVFNMHGFYYYDYFDYELYHKTLEEANKFLSRRYWYRVYKASNNSKYLKALKDKEQFNDRFKKYVKREYLNMDKASFEEFEKFVKKYPKFFGKPIEGTGGVGAGIINSKDYKDIETLYKYCKKQHLIVEDIVKQHKEMAKFNKSTVNTIRMYSLYCADGVVRPMIACIRVGREGNDVDNFHCGGMTAVIDIETGTVASDAIDLHHHLSDVHPDSKLKFKGFKIPCWDKVIKAIEESGKLLPEIRHIGWDIAIKDDGNIELIEGNSMPNFDVTQAPDQIGKLHIYEKHIAELEKLKNDKIKK